MNALELKRGHIELPNGHWRAEDSYIRAVCSCISLLLRSVSATFPKLGSIVTPVTDAPFSPNYAHARVLLPNLLLSRGIFRDSFLWRKFSHPPRMCCMTLICWFPSLPSYSP
jgi:hypothetical protein